MDSLRTITTRRTNQSEKARPDQVRNAAGGYGFDVGDDEQLRRFLVLGISGGSYYTSEQALTRDNADVVMRVAASRPQDLVRLIVEISTAGRAPRQNPAIFALAVAASVADEDGRRMALAAIPQVCRTATHLFLFNSYLAQFRGRGPAVNRAVAKWYTDKPVDRLAYQMVKYRSREGWDHAGLLRMVRPQGVIDPARRMAFNWALGKGLNDYSSRLRSSTREELQSGVRADGSAAKLERRATLGRVEVVPDALRVIADFEDAQNATSAKQWVQIINRGSGLSWEMLPDAALNEPTVWEALLTSERGVPQTALIRQLGRLSRLGLCDGDTGRLICEQIVDERRLKMARVHPINVLIAQKTYASGHGMRGSSTWPVVPKVVDALDAGFSAAFCAVEPSGVRMLYGVDTSGSMSWGQINGVPLQPREVCAALATVAAGTEPDATFMRFDTRADRLDISRRRRLDDVMNYLAQMPGGGTDCSLPMRWAEANDLKVDCFVILTDNESWYGSMHPFQALEQYRRKTGINARLVSIGMTATRNSINVPDDALTLDVVGFDTAVPQLTSDFAGGRV